MNKNIITDEIIADAVKGAKDALENAKKRSLSADNLAIRYGDSGRPATLSKRMGPNGQYIKDDYTALHDRMVVGLGVAMSTLAITGYVSYAFHLASGGSFDFSTHLACNVILLPPALLGAVNIVHQTRKAIAVHKVRKAFKKLDKMGLNLKDINQNNDEKVSIPAGMHLLNPKNSI